MKDFYSEVRRVYQHYLPVTWASAPLTIPAHHTKGPMQALSLECLDD